MLFKPWRQDTANRKYVVGFMKAPSGKYLAEEFLEEQKQSDRLAIDRVFRELETKGGIANPERFKKLKGGTGLWECKRYQIRVFCFRDENRFVFTHGYIKQEDKTEKQQIERGVKLMRHYSAANVSEAKK